MKKERKQEYTPPVIEVIEMETSTSIAASGAGKNEELGLWDIL